MKLMKIKFLLLALLLMPSILVAQTFSMTETNSSLTIMDSSGKHITLENVVVYSSIVSLDQNLVKFKEMSISAATSAIGYIYFKIINPDGSVTFYMPIWNVK